MSKLKRLVDTYRSHISVPWRDNISPTERVIFCVYNETEELRLRNRVAEFELATRESGHGWLLFDLTDTFALWLSGQRYRDKYFTEPDLLGTLLPKYLDFLEQQFREALERGGADKTSVVALIGVGSLFGFLRVNEVVQHLAESVPGKLLVLFPGSYENNNYRLLDGYDGWNYLSVPLTADSDF